MPITPYLDGERFDPEVRTAMGVAFEMARASTWIRTRQPALPHVDLARKIIELAKAGEIDPNRLCELTLAHFGDPGPASANAAS
jgi:hypothetical protein